MRAMRNEGAERMKERKGKKEQGGAQRHALCRGSLGFFDAELHPGLALDLAERDVEAQLQQEHLWGGRKDQKENKKTPMRRVGSRIGASRHRVGGREGEGQEEKRTHRTFLISEHQVS